MLRDPGLVLGRWVWFFDTLLNSKSDQLRLDILEGLPQWPVTHALGVEPTENKLIGALRSMANAKAVGPDELPVELFKLGTNHDPTVLREFHRVIKLAWHQRKVPQRWRGAVIKVLHKKKDMTKCSNYRAASHSWHTRVRPFSRSSLRDSAPTARRGTCCRKSSAGSAHTVRRRIGCSRSERLQELGRKVCVTTVPVFHGPAKGIRLGRPHTSLAGARSLWSTAEDDRGDPPVPRWDESMRAE